jgi:hypothetical protein
MAKKTNLEKGVSKSDEIIDDLARDVGAGEAAPNAAKAPPTAEAHVETMSQMFMSKGGELDQNKLRADIEQFADPAERKRGQTNLMLLVALIAVIAGGYVGLSKYASADAIKAKLRERDQAEQRHREEQIAKLKKYGEIKIESNPPGAIVTQDKDPKKCMKKDAATGADMQCVTPLDISNLEIREVYEFKLELPGYEPFEFSVAEHLWAKAPGAEDYNFQKTVDLVPSACEHWFTFDPKAKKEMKFAGETGKDDCGKFVGEQAKKQNIVPPCTCKVILPGAPGSTPGAAPKK